MIFKKQLIILFISSSLIFSESFSVEEKSDSLIVKDPDIAKKISFIPGAGQFYNEDYLKGSLFFLSEIYSIYMANKFSGDINKRNSFIWWAIAIYILNITDAYIDAELSSFPNEGNELDIKEE